MDTFVVQEALPARLVVQRELAADVILVRLRVVVSPLNARLDTILQQLLNTVCAPSDLRSRNVLEVVGLLVEACSLTTELRVLVVVGMVFTGFDVLNIIPAFAYTASAIRDVAVLVVSVAGPCQCTLHGEGIGV
jgi:hypothetical protein